MPQAKPWYRKKRILVPLVIGLLLLLWLVPPVVAGPTPVGLDAQGEQARASGGWQTVAVADNPSEIAGGLVWVDTKQLNKGTSASYLYSTIEIDIMLPKGFVEPVLRDRIVALMEERGLTVDPETEEKGNLARDGPSGALYTMTGTTQGIGNIPAGLAADVFIGIWRCSITGSWGTAVGVAAEGGVGGSGFGLPGLPGGETIEPQQAFGEMRNQLLPNTVCLG